MLTEVQSALLMEAISVLKNNNIGNIKALKEALLDRGHQEDDISAALTYWGNREKRSCEQEESTEKLYSKKFT